MRTAASPAPRTELAPNNTGTNTPALAGTECDDNGSKGRTLVSGEPKAPHLAERLRCAELTLRPLSAHMYREFGSNAAEPGTVDLEHAVLSGRPFFGQALPHLWAIDIDQPGHPGYTTLKTALDLAGLEFIELDSGNRSRSGRHIFVRVGEDSDGVDARNAIQRHVCAQHPDSGRAIDWRRQVGGSPIRPPLGLHCNGHTHSEPLIGRSDAVELLEDWFSEDGGGETQRTSQALPMWAEALRRGEWDRYAQLSPDKPLRLGASGNVDRSAVDMKLALAYRNNGLGEGDWLTDRSPGGPFPSPKAEEHATPDSYLRRQWQEAMSRPEATDNTRNGMDRLEEFIAVIDQDTALTTGQRLLLRAAIAEAQRHGKSAIGVSWLDLQEAGGLSSSTVADAIKADGVLRYLVPEDRAVGQVQTYRLQILEWCKSRSPLSDMGVTGLSTSPVAPRPPATHPIFWERPGALRQSGYQTLLTFGAEPQRKAEAMRRAVGVSPRTWKTRAAELIEVGAVIEASPGMFAVCEAFDWDALAARRGLIEVHARHVDAVNDRRLDRIDSLEQRGWIEPEDAEKQRRRVEARRVGRVLNESHRSIDTWTGEVTHPSQQDASQGSTASVGSCAACGRGTSRREPQTGLWWCAGCLMPSWLVRWHEGQGVTIPSELRRPWTPPPEDPFKWTESAPVQSLPTPAIQPVEVAA